MFIVLEGIDGAGKGRQREELEKILKPKYPSLTTLTFPDHDSHIYKNIIHPALHEEIKLTSAAFFNAFALDQLLWQEQIKTAAKSKTEHFLADGYFTTNIVYQCLLGKSFTLKQALEYAKIFKFPKPDLVIFVDVDPEVAFGRKMKEEGHEEGLDIYERSMEKQAKIRSAYKRMVRENIFGKWVEVDGNLTIEEVRDLILAVIKKHNLL